MASFNGLNAPSLAFNEASAAESGIITLYGSFQVNTTAGALQAQASTATSSVGFRGNWFTASRLAVGVYRVQLVGLNVKNNLVAVNTTAGNNGQPNGLLAEPKAWLVADGAALSVLSSTAGYATSPGAFFCVCSKFDPGLVGTSSGIFGATTAQTFDIFTYSTAFALVEAPSTARVCFELAYKALAQTP
jgi:hypothetical protein